MLPVSTQEPSHRIVYSKIPTDPPRTTAWPSSATDGGLASPRPRGARPPQPTQGATPTAERLRSCGQKGIEALHARRGRQLAPDRAPARLGSPKGIEHPVVGPRHRARPVPRRMGDLWGQSGCRWSSSTDRLGETLDGLVSPTHPRGLQSPPGGPFRPHRASPPSPHQRKDLCCQRTDQRTTRPECRSRPPSTAAPPCSRKGNYTPDLTGGSPPATFRSQWRGGMSQDVVALRPPCHHSLRKSLNLITLAACGPMGWSKQKATWPSRR